MAGLDQQAASLRSQPPPGTLGRSGVQMVCDSKETGSMGSDAAEDRHFQHYSLKHRLISWTSRNLFDRVSYTAQHGLIRGMKRRGGLGWMPARFSGPPTAEENFWRGLDLNGFTIYDVGAFEGLLTLFFARAAQQVICYEPNARNRGRLQANLRLNGLTNVTVRPFGLGETPVELQMVWDPSMPGGASVETAVVDNLRSTVAEAQAQPVSITTLDLDRAQQNLPAPDLIKIDIEGWELQALLGARETIAASMPALYLEMHGETMREKMRKAAEIVDVLEHAGYPSIRHVESGEAISSANSKLAAEGHLYCPAGAGARATPPLQTAG